MLEQATTLAPVQSTGDDIILDVEAACCRFDVSAPALSRLFSGETRRILRAVESVSFTVKRGTTFSIVGESGCGKSTLARMVVGLQRPTEGKLSFRDIRRADGTIGPPRVQMIFQDPYASLNPRWRVGEIIAEPIRELNLRAYEAAIQQRVGDLLETVGLSRTDASRYPHAFSGGQRQRISIARALATEADFLVCDEPTSALDVSVQAQILNLVVRLQKEFGLTYLFISHNLSVVRHMSDDIAIMYLGRFVEAGPAEQVFTKPQHPYTRLLLDTIPDVERPNRERRPMSGEVPSPISPPAGCTFNPRCTQAADRCRVDRPELRQLGGVDVSCHFA
ncbi:MULTISPECIES: ABC transporter ATP-binding protein [Bosea]|uniref:ABC transporter ATP-binding protein n=1 Tax=Bosea TaxID=85413 RepID=UPI0021503E79|nr:MULTISPECIES: oligopeptide/dipeptide ABC transporter ATP-binding protein [Bosea]MCR4523844.1 ATP-binding cassette domain-containing protein [Bosea sp. 47.2.35]MDR6830338.1 peptide/nickel transport system ATP-binding protein [Bosea robiniae]MDR6897093.1 peptide/nickel transport system ATP-binding protein [Bosea sp. BE109]MDR7140490.1 peptide/nickel transport system ATP-binding protein [Bosea sp. BE168]MDR7177189.1 peptide/nickel transport system ATP-binding protein [Bosea sp. BE271]